MREEPVRPPPKPGRRRRALARASAWTAGILCVGLASLAVWTRTEDFQRRAVPTAEALCALQTAHTCAITAVHVRFGPPALRIEGLRITAPGEEQAWLSADAVDASLTWGVAGPRLGRLRLEAPRLRVLLDAQGRAHALATLKRGGRPMTRLPWTQLVVTDASALVAWPEGELTLEGLQVSPRPGAEGLTGRVDVAADLAIRHRDQADTARLRWENLLLAGERVELPELRVDTRTLDLTASGVVPLQGPVQLSLALVPDLADLSARLPHPYAAHGSAEIDVQLSGPPAALQGAINLRWEGAQVDLPGVVWPVIHYRFGDLEAWAVADRHGVDIESLRTVWADGEVLVRGRVESDGAVPNLEVEGHGLSFARILQDLEAAPNPWIDFRGEPTLSLSGQLKPFALDGDFSLAVTDLRVAQGPVLQPGKTTILALPHGGGEGRIHIDAQHVVLEASRVESGPNRGHAHIDIGTRPKGPLYLDATLTEVDLAWFRPLGGAELTGKGTMKGVFEGPFNQIRLRGEGDLEGFSVMGIPYADQLQSPIESDLKVLSLPQVRARRGATRYGGAWSLDFRNWWMDTDVVVFEGRVEDAVGMFVDLDGLTGDMKGTLELVGPINDLNGEAHLELADTHVYGEGFPSGSAHGYMREGVFTLDDLRLLRDNGRGGAILRGSVGRGWALNMDLVADGLRLERLDHLRDAGVPLEGDLSLQATLGNTLFDPAPVGRLSVRNVRYNGHPVEGSSVRFETIDGTLAWSGKLVGGSVAARGLQGLWGDQPYEVDAFFSRFPAHIFYPVGADGRPVQATVTGSLALSGQFGPEPTPVDLKAEVQTAALTWAHHQLTNPRPWRYEQRGHVFELSDFALEGGVTQVALSASNALGTLQASGGGVIDFDLARLVVPDLTRAEGRVDWKVRAHGAAGAVDALVDATLDATLIEHAAFPGLFEDAHAEVLATHDRVNILSATASLGGGSVTGRGRILTEDWSPKRFELRGAAEDAQIRWVDWLPPAIGNAAFSFDGPVDSLLLSAEVEVTEMSFSERMNWEDWVVEFRDYLVVGGGDALGEVEDGLFALDVRIDADRTIQLANNLAEGNASASLRVIGDTARAGLLGHASVHDGLVFLNDREFTIERGEMAWRDPWTWDPQLDFELSSDLTSRDRRYRVFYRILGPFSDWRTESRSEPPLSQADINALLWFGVTADDLEGMGDLYSAIGQGVADMVLADLFASNSVVGAEDVRSLVRVDIATGVNTRGEYSPDPRLVLERRFDEVGGTDLRWELNMVRTQDWYLRADNRLSDNLSLSAWYASQSRSPTAAGGAVGLDLRFRTEWDE